MQDIREFFEQHNKAAIAFSGGVDSAYLLYLTIVYGVEVQAYFVYSDFQPVFELEDAMEVAEFLQIPLRIIPMEALSEEVAANPSDRCYHCKKRLFAKLMEAAKEDGFTEIFDGTNASDDAEDRPGMRALAELSVYSPLRLCGITKDMVREGAREVGISVWNKPSYACLATRVPTGQKITKELLEKIEVSEDWLRVRGYEDFRVRIAGNRARLELPEQYFEKIMADREELLSELGSYFDGMDLNLTPRKGRES